MTSTKEVHDKIVCINNMQKVTKAMEIVAASKMLKTQERIAISLPYTEKIRKVIGRLALGNLEYKHPYLETRDIKHIGYLVISTDRGLTGNLNIKLFKNLLIDMETWHKKGIGTKMALIGSKAVSFFKSIRSKVIAQVTGMGDNPTLSELIGLVQVMLKAYDEYRIDQLYIVSNKFINTLLQSPQISQVLPILPDEEADIKNKYWDYLYEPNPKMLLDILLRRYVESQVYQSVVENLASEQAARMIAMKTATDNSNSLIGDLQLLYNKVRQTSITQELTEIISGAAAV